ncbi:unnamed protein product [Rhizoctonia solani]|uniref:MYND-type domain-containing protein n=1 Tax=Rhizoctonia solani TaxID=456999 RepID=A0A8H3HQV5_9AGAM|nr:unnamed protein product [Rhizoctonia solani]
MLALAQKSHPVWGRPLDQYAHAYQLSAFRKNVHGATPRLLAILAAKQIGRYSDRTDMPDSIDVSEQVTISTLEAVLKMAEDVDTYKTFLSPRLIGGCITLMQTVKVSGKTSPFSYEYGYLCFRILLFSLGMQMLSGGNDLELTMQNMITSPDIETPLVFSSHVARVVEVQTDRAVEGFDCDYILGWGPASNQPVVSPEQARALLEIVWSDRANFLKALMSAYTPALSGLLFLLWRYVVLDGARANPPAPNTDLIQLVMEIYSRCLLVATSDQTAALFGVSDELGVLIFTLGQRIGAFAHTEDSQIIFEACIRRLAPSDTRIYAPPNAILVTGLLGFLALCPAPGLDEAHLSVFNAAVERFWSELTSNKKTPTLLIEGIGLLLKHPRLLLQANSRTDVHGQSIKTQVLESLVKHDLFDLVAAVLLRLDPNAEEKTTAFHTNTTFLQSVTATFEAIGDSLTPSLLESFRGYATNWLKVEHQIITLGLCMDLSHDRKASQKRERHFGECNDAWLLLARVLQLDLNAEPTGCKFTRCQDPIVIVGLDRRGLGYACSKCKAVSYCSVQCQTGD